MSDSAIIDPTGTYRYTLRREWSANSGRRMLWIMLNPSTADATTDDATIRKCRVFSRRWGYDALTVVNLFALRATDPRALLTADEPRGPDNDRHIEDELRRHEFVVAAWGAWGSHGRLAWREDEMIALARKVGRDLHHLGLTTRQQPKHPLYLPGDTIPIRMRPW